MAVLLFGSMYGPHMCTFPAVDVRLNRIAISALIAFTDVSYIFNYCLFMHIKKNVVSVAIHPSLTLR